MRDSAKFLIDVNTDSPISDMLKISQVLDSMHPDDLPDLKERYLLDLLIKRTTFNTKSSFSEDIIVEYLTYFNKEKVNRFIQHLTDEEFEALENICQDVK